MLYNDSIVYEIIEFIDKIIIRQTCCDVLKLGIQIRN